MDDGGVVGGVGGAGYHGFVLGLAFEGEGGVGLLLALVDGRRSDGRGGAAEGDAGEGGDEEAFGEHFDFGLLLFLIICVGQL